MHCILRINRQTPRLNVRDRDGHEWCTFPIGGRNVSQPKYVAVGKVCEDVVCGTVPDEGVEGEQRFEDNLLWRRMRRKPWHGVTGHNLWA